MTVTLTSLLVVWADSVQAQPVQVPQAGGTDGDHGPAWSFESGGGVTLFPAGDVFPVYVADPHRPTNALLFSFYTDQQIPGAQARRTRLSAGGRFGMVRFDTAGPHPRSWQVSLDAGLDGLFDSNASDDAIGWDGNYGLTVTTASNSPWSFKVALLHTSAHVGDEYEDQMNRQRINYTREEAAFGVGWKPTSRWRTYGEVAYSYYLGSDAQAPWRLQQGVEYEGPPKLGGGRFGWYWAVDFDAMQERGWRIDRAIQGGIVAHAGRQVYRFALEYYDGRPVISEFFSSTEASISFGLRIDM